jgi:hypothetical protein
MNVYLFIFELIHTWIVIQCSIYTLSYCVCDYCDWQFDKEKKKKKKERYSNYYNQMDQVLSVVTPMS